MIVAQRINTLYMCTNYHTVCQRHETYIYSTYPKIWKCAADCTTQLTAQHDWRHATSKGKFCFFLGNIIQQQQQQYTDLPVCLLLLWCHD